MYNGFYAMQQIRRVNGKILYLVRISCWIYDGTTPFNNRQDAENYLKSELESLKSYGIKPIHKPLEKTHINLFNAFKEYKLA